LKRLKLKEIQLLVCTLGRLVGDLRVPTQGRADRVPAPTQFVNDQVLMSGGSGWPSYDGRSDLSNHVENLYGLAVRPFFFIAVVRSRGPHPMHASPLRLRLHLLPAVAHAEPAPHRKRLNRSTDHRAFLTTGGRESKSLKQLDHLHFVQVGSTLNHVTSELRKR
jgi:hypothetical protein